MIAASKIENEELPLITNARFLDIGDGKHVVGGTLEGRTFYSAPIEQIDRDDIIRTAEGSFRYSRSIH